MLRVGITGGIGSGKTTVARVFEVLGIPVYYADSAAKDLMEEDPALRSLIQEHFGEAVYKQGKLDRSYLSSLVFNNKPNLELLNSLVHPATIHAGLQWMEQQRSPYAIKEAALIFESGSQEHLDFIIGVYAPEALRLQRVMSRDGLTREKIKQRMKNQLEESLKMKLCHAVIQNDGQQLVIPQVLKLHKELLAFASEITTHSEDNNSSAHS